MPFDVLPEGTITRKRVLYNGEEVELELAVCVVKNSHMKYFSFIYANVEKGIWEPPENTCTISTVFVMDEEWQENNSILPIDVKHIIQMSEEEQRRRQRLGGEQ